MKTWLAPLRKPRPSQMVDFGRISAAFAPCNDLLLAAVCNGIVVYSAKARNIAADESRYPRHQSQ